MITTYLDLRWYEAKVTGWKCTSSLQSLVVSILARDNVPNCKINFIDEVTDQRSSICSHNPFPP